MHVNILAVEGVAEIIGRIVAKLRAGMIEGGMTPESADALIVLTVEMFLNFMVTKMGEQGGHIQ